MSAAAPGAATYEARSTLTCPFCGHSETLSMATDACLARHDCSGCGAILAPRAGDCCVFCSFGDRPCPPKQAEAACCGGKNMDAAPE